jgi:hypothetical protein
MYVYIQTLYVRTRCSEKKRLKKENFPCVADEYSIHQFVDFFFLKRQDPEGPRLCSISQSSGTSYIKGQQEK